MWLVQHLVNGTSCGNTVNEIAHTLSCSTVVEAYVWRNVACGHPSLVCGPALLLLASDRVVGSTCCRLLRVEFTVTQTSGTKVFLLFVVTRLPAIHRCWVPSHLTLRPTNHRSFTNLSTEINDSRYSVAPSMQARSRHTSRCPWSREDGSLASLSPLSITRNRHIPAVNGPFLFSNWGLTEPSWPSQTALQLHCFPLRIATLLVASSLALLRKPVVRGAQTCHQQRETLPALFLQGSLSCTLQAPHVL